MSVGDVCGDVVRELWAQLDEIQEMGFSLNPLDLAHNIGVLAGAIQRAWTIASEPPPGDPAAIDEAATAWRGVMTATRSQADELGSMDVAAVWKGEAANACASTVWRLEGRFDDASALALRAANAMDDFAAQIRRARRRHADAGDHLRAAQNRLGLCAPWDIADMLADVVAELIEAIRAAIGAYEVAGAAAVTCARALRGVADQMPFPDTAVPGMSVFDLMNVMSTSGRGRPLVGDVAQRAADRYAALGDGAREMVDQMLADAPSDEHRAWILATLASGASLETLANFAERIDGLSETELRAAVDPTAVTLQQQSDTTCGSASLTVARMLNDPVFALKILTGYDASSGGQVPAPTYDDLPPYRPGANDPAVETAEHLAMRQRFHEAELEAKSRTNDASDGAGGPAVPWVDAFGTSPWGAAEELNGTAGGDGYSVSLVDSDSSSDRQQAYDVLERAGLDGEPAAVYVGDGTSPRHVVLVVGAADGSLSFYEPGSGGLTTVTEEQFVSGDVDLGGWGRPWAVVAP